MRAYFPRVPYQEGSPEAGRKGGLGFGNPDFGAGHLGGVAADEVVLGLVGSEAAQRGQHSEGVAGQKDHVGGMTGQAGHLGIGNVVDGVSASGVLGNGVVVEVDMAGRLVVGDVLQHGAES